MVPSLSIIVQLSFYENNFNAFSIFTRRSSLTLTPAVRLYLGRVEPESRDELVSRDDDDEEDDPE